MRRCQVSLGQLESEGHQRKERSLANGQHSSKHDTLIKNGFHSPEPTGPKLILHVSPFFTCERRIIREKAEKFSASLLVLSGHQRGKIHKLVFCTSDFKLICTPSNIHLTYLEKSSRLMCE